MEKNLDSEIVKIVSMITEWNEFAFTTYKDMFESDENISHALG